MDNPANVEATPAALFLAADCPYPTIGGGALRAASLIEYLAPRYELDVIVFRQPGAPDPVATRLGELAARVGVIELPFHGRDTWSRGARNLTRLLRGRPPLLDRFSGFSRQLETLTAGRRYQVAIVEHFWCAPYADILRPKTERLVMDLHNIESALHASCAAVEPLPLALVHRRFESLTSRLERRWLPRYSMVLAASEEDAARVHAIAPSVETVVYPNTIPLVAQPERPRENVIMFTGNLEYHPNIDAVRYFAREIWPIIREHSPEVVWELVGINPHAVARYVAGDERIRLRGPVDDAIRELARAKVAVVPLRAGSGTRIKILEAWCAGTPVVSTTLGREGLTGRDGESLLVADEPEQFAAHVNALLGTASLQEGIGASGRDQYQKHYTWQTGWRVLSRYQI